MSDIAGRISPTPPALRYVVLRHEGIDNPHYDLMFETMQGSSLVTWRSQDWPIQSDTPLLRLADHRREYLDYEGSVSGDRGHVSRITTGYYKLDRMDDGFWRLTFRDLMATSQLEFHHEAEDRWTARPRRI